MSSELQAHYVRLEAGAPAPWFVQRNTSNPNYVFSSVAGRYVVMCFFLSAGDAIGRMTIDAVQSHQNIFDDNKACFFGISTDPDDEINKRIFEQVPGIRYFWDFDSRVSRAYGAMPVNQSKIAPIVHGRRFWLILDPTLRIMKSFPMISNGANIKEIFEYVANLPPPEQFSGIELQAPILYLPNVFEPTLCKKLISLYDVHGGTESGFMREVNGKTVTVTDPRHKRRSDYTVGDEDLIRTLQQRVKERIVPEIRKVYQFETTRMERYIVACYSSQNQGHFGAHRDNTTKGTAHRRFAVSINLNSDFEGGEISFPEYNHRGYKPPIGGAVVFSCSLLHTVSPVTRGQRYAFLPFLYDEAAAKVRLSNNAYLDNSIGDYTSA